MRPYPYLFFVIILLPALAAGQNFEEDNEGVNWSKTLRIRGVISRYDPFNETSLYRVGSGRGGAKITASADLVQFETIASGFWGVLRDSLQQALRSGELNVYTLGFPSTGGKAEIRTKRTKVTYSDLLDSLSFAFQNFVSPSDRLIQIYEPTEGAATGMARLVDRMRSQARGKRIINDLQLFTVFELELSIAVDETGFKIKPVGLIFGTAHWPEEIYFRPNNLLSQLYTGYDTSDPRQPKNIGFYVDLSEAKTVQWLVENGMKYSGERNIIPFYDLMTMFHYPYKIYAESNYVLAVEAFAFKGKYDLDELEKTLLDRYNDMIYTYLYGQAPEWWDQGNRGAFTNGMFEIDTVRKNQAEGPAVETPEPESKADSPRKGTASGGGASKATQRGGNRSGAADGQDDSAKKPAPSKRNTGAAKPAPAKPKKEEAAEPKSSSSRRRKRGN